MKDGIYTDITIQAYHENRTHFSATSLKMAKRSLKEFNWWRTGKLKQEDKTHFSFGNAFELALLDKEGFAKEVAILKDSEWLEAAFQAKPDLVTPRNSGTYQALKNKFMAESFGKYIINEKGKESFETIQHMLESCYQDAVIQRLIKNVEYQVSLFWTDSETGLKLKTRPDICKRKKNVIVNLKTTEDGSPQGFSKDMVNYDYPLQACIEIRGCLATGLMEQVDSYYWLVVEKSAPYNATIYEYDTEDLKWGMDQLDYVLNKTQRALEQDLYPGYSEQADNKFGVLKAIIPPYYKML